jgi:hypothetical protein
MSENTNTELAIVDNTPGLANELANMSKGGVSVFSTITGTDFKSKVAVVNAIQNASPVADNLGKTIALANVVVQPVEMTNERTGELQTVPRVTLIDGAGKAYHCISDVVYKDLKTIFGVIGHPSTWPAPLDVVVNKEKGKVGSYFTLNLK